MRVARSTTSSRSSVHAPDERYFHPAVGKQRDDRARRPSSAAIFAAPATAAPDEIAGEHLALVEQPAQPLDRLAGAHDELPVEHVGVEDRRDEPVLEVAQPLHELARRRLDRDDLHRRASAPSGTGRRPSACRSCRARRRTRRPPGSRARSRDRCPRSARAGSPGCRTGTAARATGRRRRASRRERIAPLLPSSPGDSTTSAPKISRSWRRSIDTFSGITTRSR